MSRYRIDHGFIAGMVLVAVWFIGLGLTVPNAWGLQ
jgi:hypothetical protein